MEVPVMAPQLGFRVSQLTVHTAGPTEFVDITDAVLGAVDNSDARNGLVVVSSRHTTASIVVNEHEPELLKDLTRLLRRVAPPENTYGHNKVPCPPYEQPNGHAHCQALLLSASVSIPLLDGSLALGRYQRIFLVELDCPRQRQVAISILGS